MTASSSTSTPAHALTGVTPLPQLGLIRAEGADAASFLHGQLTQDFALLGLSEARLAAFCSPKGRMLASFIGLKRRPDEILLVCSRDVLPATLKRLSMFVLRAQVRLSDASDSFSVCGVTGHLAGDLPGKPWSKLGGTDGAQWVRLHPAEGVARALWVGASGAPGHPAVPDGPALDAGQWAWLDVMSGVAMITQPVVEAFVPQMLNYESIGGVNFKKGCYPGQEVVARSQFRGTLKRRAYRVRSGGALAVGMDVFHESDASQPCGTVAAAAANPDGGWNAIVSMQTSAAGGGRLNAGSTGGPELAILPLPYALLDDI